jgi:hypothetical protein
MMNERMNDDDDDDDVHLQHSTAQHNDTYITLILDQDQIVQSIKKSKRFELITHPYIFDKGPGEGGGLLKPRCH